MPLRALDFAAVGSLTFEPVDTDTFACLRLAREVGIAGGTAPCVLNAANEMAVAAFLDRRIRFDQIHQVNAETLATVVPSNPGSLADLLALDAQSRSAAAQAIARLT